jgi:hypothetical protein
MKEYHIKLDREEMKKKTITGNKSYDRMTDKDRFLTAGKKPLSAKTEINNVKKELKE